MQLRNILPSYYNPAGVVYRLDYRLDDRLHFCIHFCIHDHGVTQRVCLQPFTGDIHRAQPLSVPMPPRETISAAPTTRQTYTLELEVACRCNAEYNEYEGGT